MADCSVCVDMSCDETFDSFEKETVAATEPQQCYECRAAIEVGTKYCRIAFEDDGKTGYFHVCAPCAEIADVFVCGSWVVGILWECMEEQAFPELTTATECFAKLSPSGKAFLLNRWRKWKGFAA